jgi:RNA polymerase sigma-70 factor, ECF subfamily
MIQSLDKGSFEALFRAEFKGLTFFAHKYVKDIETAREIVQDSFISLWEKRESIDMSRPVKSYLTMIIHNKCQNHLRDNRKFNTDLLEIENLLEVSEIVHTDFLVQEELSAAIQKAIDELPEKCREIFLLNRYENLKYSEIATKLELSQKTVEAQMSKALQHMRLRLADYIAVGWVLGVAIETLVV